MENVINPRNTLLSGSANFHLPVVAVVIVIVTQHLFCIWFGFITSVNRHMKINTNTFNSSTFYLLDLSKGNNINTRTSIYIEKGTPLAPDHGLNNL